MLPEIHMNICAEYAYVSVNYYEQAIYYSNFWLHTSQMFSFLRCIWVESAIAFE